MVDFDSIDVDVVVDVVLLVGAVVIVVVVDGVVNRVNVATSFSMWSTVPPLLLTVIKFAFDN